MLSKHLYFLEPIILTCGNEEKNKIILERLKKYNIRGTLFDNTGFSATVGHRRIIEKLRNEKKDYGFILEDDAFFLDDFKSLYPIVIDELNKLNWDIFYWGGNILNSVQKISEHIVLPNLVYCNHAYFIHNKVYDKVIDLLNQENAIADVLFTNSNINLYMSNPMLITQVGLNNDYNIHNIMMKSYFDHIFNNNIAISKIKTGRYRVLRSFPLKKLIK